MTFKVWTCPAGECSLYLIQPGTVLAPQDIAFKPCPNGHKWAWELTGARPYGLREAKCREFVRSNSPCDAVTREQQLRGFLRDGSRASAPISKGKVLNLLAQLPEDHGLARGKIIELTDLSSDQVAGVLQREMARRLEDRDIARSDNQVRQLPKGRAHLWSITPWGRRWLDEYAVNQDWWQEVVDEAQNNRIG